MNTDAAHPQISACDTETVGNYASSLFTLGVIFVEKRRGESGFENIVKE
jgi:hypothetical protein